MTVDTINQLSAQHAHTGSLILATSSMHVLANQKTIHEDKSFECYLQVRSYCRRQTLD